LDKLAEVTPKDLQHVAQKYLQSKSRVIGIYIPKGMEH
jgi:predicted Zn-dependent peptidase